MADTHHVYHHGGAAGRLVLKAAAAFIRSINRSCLPAPASSVSGLAQSISSAHLLHHFVCCPDTSQAVALRISGICSQAVIPVYVAVHTCVQ